MDEAEIFSCEVSMEEEICDPSVITDDHLYAIQKDNEIPSNSSGRSTSHPASNPSSYTTRTERRSSSRSSSPSLLSMVQRMLEIQEGVSEHVRDMAHSLQIIASSIQNYVQRE